jgi:hypothetical protein
VQSIDSGPIAASWHGGCSQIPYRRIARGDVMQSRFDGRPGNGSRRAAAAIVLGACGSLAVALVAGAAPNWLRVADAPAQDSSEAQQVPAQPSTPSQPKSLEESERSGKPERRQRIRDEGPEDELQSRSRLLLAFVDRRAGTPA